MTNTETIRKIKDIIVKVEKPEKIILFGSYARGNPSKDSDIDIMIVKESRLPRCKRGKAARKSLTNFLFPKDIIVYTPSELEYWKDVPCSFAATVIKEGKILYEQK